MPVQCITCAFYGVAVVIVTIIQSLYERYKVRQLFTDFACCNCLRVSAYQSACLVTGTCLFFFVTKTTVEQQLTDAHVAQTTECFALSQVNHSPGKPGKCEKVREFQGGQGKVSKNEKKSGKTEVRHFPFILVSCHSAAVTATIHKCWILKAHGLPGLF